MEGVKKAVIPVAGLGTRLFPATMVQPKEMLPVFSYGANGEVSVKPTVQVIFENLFDVGFREFCFVVGRGKRIIEDHFMPNIECIKDLEYNGKNTKALEIDSFYDKVEASNIMWVNQPERKGFGHAVSMAQPFVQDEKCLVHAGDGCLLSGNMDYIDKLLAASERFDADAVFLALEVDDPRPYGTVEGPEIETNIIKVQKVVEKPKHPTSKYAIMAMYVFKPAIFEAIEACGTGKSGEYQLTDAIQKLVDWKLDVYAVKLDNSYKRLDVGNPTAYYEALRASYKQYSQTQITSNNPTINIKQPILIQKTKNYT